MKNQTAHTPTIMSIYFSKYSSNNTTKKTSPTATIMSVYSSKYSIKKSIKKIPHSHNNVSLKMDMIQVQ